MSTEAGELHSIGTGRAERHRKATRFVDRSHEIGQIMSGDHVADAVAYLLPGNPRGIECRLRFGDRLICQGSREFPTFDHGIPHLVGCR